MNKKNYSIGVVFATRPNIKNLQGILSSLDKQTYSYFKVYILIDKVLTNREFDDLKKVLLVGLKNIKDKINFISNISDPKFNGRNNVSYIRNYGIGQVKEDFVQIFDDDEVFESDYFQKMIDLWIHEFNKEEKDFVLVPAILFRDTKQVQTFGFSYYNYWLSRPESQYFGDRNLNFFQTLINNLFVGTKYQESKNSGDTIKEIQMCSMNSVFGPKGIFEKIHMDECFDFVYEDLDFTYRIYKSGYKILVTNSISVHHMERDKTLLEHAWVGNEYASYRKAKHKIIFIRKHGTFFDKVKFYLFGFRGQPLWLFLKILIYGGKKRGALIFAHLKGIRDGLKMKV